MVVSLGDDSKSLHPKMSASPNIHLEISSLGFREYIYKMGWPIPNRFPGCVVVNLPPLEAAASWKILSLLEGKTPKPIGPRINAWEFFGIFTYSLPTVNLLSFTTMKKINHESWFCK